MLQNVAIQKRVRVAFDPRFPIEGEVVGVERGDDDSVAAIMVRSPVVEGGTVYFLAEDLAGAEVTLPAEPAGALPN